MTLDDRKGAQLPIYSFNTFSNTQLGRASLSFSTGTYTVSGDPQVMQVLDDDAVFDDETNASGETLDTSQQTLAAAFGPAAAGQVVRSVYMRTITNNTTGQTGTAYLIRIYSGTSPTAPGDQVGEYYNSFSIEVSAGDSITLSAGGFVGQTPYSNLFVCFTAGTWIMTNRGEVLIDDLREGDGIVTRDNGVQPLRWIGRRVVPAQGAQAPVHIAQDVLGNHRPLSVSPNHRMLIEAASADLYFAEREVFVAAKHLVGSAGIVQQVGGLVSYQHMLFDRHEVVFANGAPSESFFPGKSALNSLDAAVQAEVYGLFPELRTAKSRAFDKTARLCLTQAEVNVLAQVMA